MEKNESWRPLQPSEGDAATLASLVVIHSVSVLVGGIGALVNVPLLLVLGRFFRSSLKLLFCLALGDLLNCVAICALGLERRSIYERALEEGIVPVETSWSCVWKTSVWLRVVGNLWPPAVQLLCASERLLSVLAPFWYRRLPSTKDWLLVSLSLVFTLSSLVAGFFIAWLRREEGGAKFYCGRKSAFGAPYGQFVYATIVFGYSLSFLLALLALILVRKASASISTVSTGNKPRLLSNEKRIRYHVAISFASTLLVSIPNCTSLFSSLFERVFSLFPLLFQQVNDVISEPSNWAAAINSSLNIFVYLALNLEFRRAFLSFFLR